MRQVKKNLSIVSFVLGVLILFSTCNSSDNKIIVKRDFKDIRNRGKIVAVTNFNTIDYFIFNGRPMGFQFELLQRFAEYTGMQLEIVASNDNEDLTEKLLDGSCDIVAVGMPVTSDVSKQVTFTEPLMQSRQVLVQRKPDNWRDLDQSDINKCLIISPLDLAGKTIVVQRGTAYAQRLKNISNEIGQEIDIVQVPEHEEQLIQFVAGNEIEYTICDERIALVNQKYYPQLDVSTVISFPQNLSWVVRENSPELLNELNKFLVREKQNSHIAIIGNKYYQNQWSATMVSSEYFVLNTGRISPFDDEIRKYSEELNWDWRLLAALIYQESNFNPSVKSYAGAYGLMQILPATAQRFGVDSIQATLPKTNISVGVKLLKWLDLKFVPIIKDENERIKFVLAAYNTGIGHVIDAQLLTSKYGKDMTKWNDVREFLLNKSQPKYYNDSIVKFGYCNGMQTYLYVSDILSLFKHYKNITSKL